MSGDDKIFGAAPKPQLPTEWSDESRDLCALAADRVSASLESVTQLCTTPEDGLRVSISALAEPLGAAVGFYAVMTGREPHGIERREILTAVLELVDEANAARAGRDG